MRDALGVSLRNRHATNACEEGYVRAEAHAEIMDGGERDRGEERGREGEREERIRGGG